VEVEQTTNIVYHGQADRMVVAMVMVMAAAAAARLI
jgi:hypothetical protein